MPNRSSRRLAHARLIKAQVHAVPANAKPAQQAFVYQIFGVAA